VYLSENKTLRMLTLCGLYLAQGVPWGFVTITFASWLAEPEQGITAEQLGPILAVATLPWSFKFLWGPLMDRFTIRALGRRRPWIIFAQSMAILILGSMILINDLPNLIWTQTPEASGWSQVIFRLVPGPLAGLILLANVFISLQDVAVDALAVDLLAENERGRANGMMYASNYLGTAIGGAGLGYIVSQYGIQAGLAGQAFLLAGIMLLPICFRERPREGKRIKDAEENLQSHTATDVAHGTTQTDNEKTTSGRTATSPLPAGRLDLANSPYLPPAPTVDQVVGETADHHPYQTLPSTGLKLPSPYVSKSVFVNLFRAFSLRATLLGAIIALGVKIGSGAITVVLLNYLMKEGGWTQAQYTSVIGGWAVMLGLGGSIAGGFLADIFGPKRVILAASLTLGTLWLSMGSIPGALNNQRVATALLLGQELLLALLSVSLFALFMSISWPRIAATQFTTYMAFLNLSTTIGSYSAGLLSGNYTATQILMFAGIVQALIVLPVLLIDPQQARRALPA
jgi:MFS transporter, PAT family, beta-lactamase induction signal transducer AmpG